MLKKQKLKNNNNSNNKSSSENTTPSAGCSSADENNNDLKINQGNNCSKKNDNSGRNKLKKGEKYTWSESDILKSLALEDSDNGSDKQRSQGGVGGGNKSSRSSRR